MTFEELLPGDLILFKWRNELFHVAIFAPEPDRASDIIDTTSNKGVARGTLEGLYHILQSCTQAGNLFSLFANVMEVSVVRSKTLPGQQIADQAEFWRLHGLSYDANSLANIVEATWGGSTEVSSEAEEVNIRKYWHYAQRRHKAMIEDPVIPSAIVVICTFFLTPVWNLPRGFVNFFVQLIHYLTKETEREVVKKGVNCVGFALTVLAAVALKDQSFLNIDACKEKLGGIAQIKPEQCSLTTVMTKVFNDSQFFEDKGVLDTKVLALKPFDKDTFHQEQEQDLAAQRNLAFA